VTKPAANSVMVPRPVVPSFTLPTASLQRSIEKPPTLDSSPSTSTSPPHSHPHPPYHKATMASTSASISTSAPNSNGTGTGTANRDSSASQPAAGPESLSELEREVLEEYARLLENLNKVRLHVVFSHPSRSTILLVSIILLSFHNPPLPRPL